MELFVIIARKIWLRRNTLIFEGSFKNPLDVLKSVMISLQDYNISLCCDNTRGLKPVASTVRKCQVWVAPPPDFIKINWDAAVNSNRGCVGFGLVARNYNSVFLAAKCIVQSQKIEAKSA
jgi:hypothetical protein